MSLINRFTKNQSGGRDLLVGDVHGCFAKLRNKLDAIGFDESRDRLFCVGDLVDRGPDSADVLRWLDEPWFHAIRGNHEEMLLDFHAERGDGREIYAINGGLWAIGMTPAERLPYVDALGSLPLAIELETDAGLVVLVHANVANERWAPVSAALQGNLSDRDLSCLQYGLQWDRSRFDAEDREPVDDVHAVVVGHTPVERPQWLGNVLHIDCGAWLKGGRTSADFVIIDAGTLSPVS